MKRTAAMMGLLLAAALLLTGCGAKESAKEAATETAAPAAETAEAAEAKTETTDEAAKTATETAAPKTEEKKMRGAEEWKALLADVDSLTEMPEEDFSDVLGIPAEEFTAALWLTADGVSGREALILRAADGNTAEHIRKQLEAYLEQRRKETRNYQPEAYALLEKAKLEGKNLTWVLIAGEKAEAETAAILDGE